jgi:spore coat protein U-like protein
MRKAKMCKVMKKTILATGVAALIIITAGWTFAGTTAITSTITVNANVTVKCGAISGGPLSLIIDPSSSGDVYSTGSDSGVQCTKGQSFSVGAASSGAGGTTSTSGSLSGKLKASGLSDIPYTLYFKSNFSGGGFGGTSTTIITAAGGTSAGVVVAAADVQAAQAGTYSDTVTLTVSY